MRVIFVQTYPVYHDLWTTEQWLAIENRDRWMPGLVAALGHDVELWAVDRAAGDYISRMDGYPDYPIRLFQATRRGSRTKFDFSDDLVEYSRRRHADLYVLKGVDGGVGVRLIDKALKHEEHPYAFVVGGKYYSRHVHHAAAVLYETEAQRKSLANPRRPWRRSVEPDRLIRLSKVVDVNRFRPMPDVEKRWDVLALGRLVAGIKSYDALGTLPRSVRVAVAGGGPALDELKHRFPEISWLGPIEHSRVPEVMNAARIFFHTGLRDYSPRVLAEAAACGVPAVAFADAIAPDVLPASCGVRVTHKDYVEQIVTLIADRDRRAALSRATRARAMETMSADAMRPAVAAMLDRVTTGAVA